MSRAVPVPVEDVCSNTGSNNDINSSNSSSNSSTSTGEIAEVKKKLDNEEAQPTSATQFTHSIKVEETAKGLRFSIHVYGNNEDETIETALRTYEKTIAKFMDHGHKLAPMEGKGQQ
jgi:hypothetical protein